MTQNDSQALFRSEYQLELETWLRRRFRYLCITLLVLTLIFLAIDALTFLLALLSEKTVRPSLFLLDFADYILSIAVLIYFMRVRSLEGATREQLLGAATRMILLLGLFWLLAVFIGKLIVTKHPQNLTEPLFYTHFFACLFLPWRPRESLRPFIPLFIAWVIMVLIFAKAADAIDTVLLIAFGPSIFLPGLAVAAWRMSRHSQSFRRRMVGRHFITMRRELSRAREIHESLFPSPYDDGHVCFEFAYTPASDLGGDFIHLHIGASGIVHLTLLDVTGHGLAAALTVNRLYGELERIRGESPNAEPGEVLSLLNRYIHLTMTRHNIYATAACVMLDPYLSRLHWASAGHPPGYSRRAGGAIADLNATTVVLGALDHEAFQPDQQTMEFNESDTLVLFTDGAFEARDRLGRQFGLNQLRELMSLQPPPRHWTKFICAAVAKHDGGRHEDVILVTSLTLCAARRQEEEKSKQAIAAT